MAEASRTLPSAWSAKVRWLLRGGIALYLAVLFVADLPSIRERYTSRSGMANWVAPLVAEGEPGATDVGIYKRGPLRGKAPGYRAVWSATRALGEPVRLAKGYPWALVAVTALFLVLLGEALAGPAAGFVAAALYLHRPGLYVSLVGLPDAWAWPFLAATMWAVQTRRWRAAVASTAGVGLFYAPAAVSAAALITAIAAPEAWRAGRWRGLLRDRRLQGVAAVGVGLILLIDPLGFLGGGGTAPLKMSFAEALGREQALLTSGLLPASSSAWQTYDVAPVAVAERLARDLVGPMLEPLAPWGLGVLPSRALPQWGFQQGIAAALLGLLGLAAFLGGEGRRPPPLLWATAATSAALYAVAAVVAFVLYYPDRYTFLTLPLCACVGLGVLVGRGVERAPAKLRGPALAGATLLGVLGWGTGITEPLAWDEDHRDAAGLLEAIGERPGRRVAGPPAIMDAVELFAEQDTFLLCQELISVAHILTGPDYEELRRRYADLHRAWYSPDPRVLAAFMERYAIDDVVVVDRFFRPGFWAHADPPCGFLPGDGPDRDPAVGPAAFLARVPRDLLTYRDQAGYGLLELEVLQSWTEAGGR